MKTTQIYWAAAASAVVVAAVGWVVRDNFLAAHMMRDLGTLERQAQQTKGTVEQIRVNAEETKKTAEQSAITSRGALQKAESAKEMVGLRKRPETDKELLAAIQDVEEKANRSLDAAHRATQYAALAEDRSLTSESAAQNAVVHIAAAKAGKGSIARKDFSDAQVSIRESAAAAQEAQERLSSARALSRESFATAAEANQSADSASQIANRKSRLVRRRHPDGEFLAHRLPPPPPQEAPIERYPNIEAPDSIPEEVDFAVQVFLTTAPPATPIRITRGKQHKGAVVIPMNAGEQEWQIGVALAADGFKFSGDGNWKVITLPRDGDSTIALFHLRAKRVNDPLKSVAITATLFHNNLFVARIERPIVVVSASSPADSNAAPILPRSTFDPEVATFPAKGRSRTITIVESKEGSDLHLFILAENSHLEAHIPQMDKLSQWISQHYAALAQAGRTLSPVDTGATQQAADNANAFGDDLYDLYAPEEFKQVFWHWYDERKSGPWTIQIVSSDPVFPWELLRPARGDKTDRQDFLGLTFKIGRWPTEHTYRTSPPQTVSLQKFVVIAPKYSADRALNGVNAELQALRSLPGYTAVGGNYSSVRSLASHLPDGVVHFAGHGESRDDHGVPQFFIELEDGQMAPSTWQSLSQNPQAQKHPFYFFNACDVGTAQRFINTVEGWAPVLLSSGASGYIGALWPISDQVAMQFASEFYNGVRTQLKSGHADVAAILTETRMRIYKNTHNPTALAYVLYGDPEMLLLSGK